LLNIKRSRVGNSALPTRDYRYAMSHFVPSNGIQMHYLDWPGGAPSLLLMPGLTGNCHAFDGLVQAGLTPRLHLIAPDLRGRGLSDKPPGGYRMIDHAVDIIGLLDQLGLDQVVLGGHSFGGLLSFYLAAHYPERVSHLVVLDATMATASPTVREQIRPALARLERVYPSFEAYLATMQQAPYYHGWQWDPRLDAYYEADVEMQPDGQVKPRSAPEHIAAAMDGVLAEPWATHLHLIEQPTLLIRATEGYGPPGSAPIVAAAHLAATAAVLPNCSSIEVGGNHQTMLYGAPAAQTVAAILDFVLTR
jgi:pimeloyl-ACP methyl ester carboxylesterase